MARSQPSEAQQPCPGAARALRALEAAAIFVALTLLAALALRAGLAFAASQAQRALATALAGAIGGLLGVATADALSGLVHFTCDRFFSPTTPLIGRTFIFPFRDHHRDPLGIHRHGLLERNGNNCLALLPLLLVLHLCFEANSIDLRWLFWQAWTLALCAALLATNEIHAWAHAPSVPRAVRRLQRWGLLLSKVAHERHHRGAHEHAYCITTGWLNPWLDRLRVFHGLERGVRLCVRASTRGTSDLCSTAEEVCMNSPRKATLSYGEGRTVEFPILKGTVGPDVIDIRALYPKADMFTYDPGFMSTASCSSKITYIDGDKGVLLYRGYPIEQLAVHCDFLEVCYLLLNGELPTAQQKQTFDRTVTLHTMVHEQLARFYTGFRRDSHPMAVLVGTVGALASFYHDSLDISNPAHRQISAFRLIAKMPTIVAMAYKYSIGQPFVYPSNGLSYAANFMRMMFAVPAEDYVVNPVLARALERIFILHADHEQNASTSTVRLAGSSGANPFACIASGIACLWGPAHGGANEACLNMLEEIGDVSRVGEYIKRAKDKSDSFRLMGFGHRVYKNYDPRAKLMRETCHEVLRELNLHDDRLFKLALKLEQIALEDDYFVDKKLYPNVDFYSGIVQRALGIPTNMFTCIFALARTVGWIAQWAEMIGDPEQKIGRPRQLYNGAPQRDVVPIERRS